MTDNINVTPGSGKVLAADDIGSVYYQRVKLSVGADGSATDFAYQGTPAVYNVTLTSANTEYSQALPASCRGFVFQCRSDVDIRYAYVTGKVATPTAPYMTLKAGNAFWKEGVSLASVTLYLASATAGVVVEIEAWT